MLNKNQYEALKNTDLGFKEIYLDYITLEEYKELGFESSMMKTAEEGGSFANYSSFFYYKPETPGLSAADLAFENSEYLRDWKRMQEDDVKLYEHGIVMIGANAGNKAKGVTYDHFEMFQSRAGTSSQVRSYKNALERHDKEYIYHDMLKGAYLTDFFKGLPSATASELQKNILDSDKRANGKTTDLFDRMLALFEVILEKELSILGNVEHIIVMGKSFYNLFIRYTNLEDKYQVHTVDHYSYGRANQAVPEFEEIYKNIEQLNT